jgi:hypothetical protein
MYESCGIVSEKREEYRLAATKKALLMDKRAFLVFADAVLHDLHSVLRFELIEPVS